MTAPAPGRRERRLWATVAVALAALFASLYPLQFVLDFLRERNLLRLSIAAAFVAATIAVAAWLARRRPGPRGWLVLAVAAAAYAVFALSLDVVQERLHLVEYGGLALLLRAALLARAERLDRSSPRRRATLEAFAWASAIGLADEIVQGILPNRHYDLRDVAFNAAAAAMALATVAALDAVTAKGSGER